MGCLLCAPRFGYIKGRRVKLIVLDQHGSRFIHTPGRATLTVRTGDTAWSVVSTAQATLTDPFDLSESDVRVAEPYRTNADLLDDLHAILDRAATPALVLRDRATVEAYRDAEGAPVAAQLA